MSRIYLDPGVPSGGGGSPPPAGTPSAPTPAPSPAPAAPPSVPTPQPDIPPAPQPNDPVIQLPDGQVMRASQVADLAKRAIGEADRKDFELFKRIKSGDPTALLEVAGIPAGGQPAPQPQQPVESPEMAALRAELAGLKQQFGEIAPTAQQLLQAQRASQARNLVVQHAEHLPALATFMKHDEMEAAHQVANHIQYARDAAAAAGRPFNTLQPEEQNQLMAAALMSAERRLAGYLTAGGWKPPAPQQAPRPTVTDNQPPRQPGQFMFRPGPDGKMLDQNGNQYAIQRDQNGNVSLIPERIPGVSTPGSTASPDQGTSPFTGGYNQQGLIAKMRAAAQAHAPQEA